MEGKTIQPPNETAGILFAGSAYALWGFFPLYWDMLGYVPPFELSIHRMAWCAIFAVAVCVARGRLAAIFKVMRTRKLLLSLAVSSVLIAANWTIYIYSIAGARIVEAALGYYITPLLSIALGVFTLGEKLSKLRLAAIVLAGVAVTVKAFGLGYVPWIAVGLALTFGFYGYMRKLTPVAALDGLAIETALLFPVTMGLVIFWALTGTGVFPSPHFSTNALLLLAGPVTAIPLAMFAAGARRVRMSTLGFLQYLSPSITLAVATLIMGEPFTRADAATFGCVWLALILVALDGRIRSLKRAEA
jgi:chloramphenicol-sensitive protein RarD